jgi:hypothetical protein
LAPFVIRSPEVQQCTARLENTERNMKASNMGPKKGGKKTPKGTKTKSTTNPTEKPQAAEGDEGGPVAAAAVDNAAAAEGDEQAPAKPPVVPVADAVVSGDVAGAGAGADVDAAVRNVQDVQNVQDVKDDGSESDKADKGDDKKKKKPRSTPVHLTDEQEEDLAEWIKANPIIYSRGNHEFLNVSKRKLLWKGKAKELNITCKFTFHFIVQFLYSIVVVWHLF